MNPSDNLWDETVRRAIIENPYRDHDAEIATEVDLDPFPLPSSVAIRIVETVEKDSATPLAATAVVRRPLELTLDLPAVIAKFDQEEA